MKYLEEWRQCRKEAHSFDRMLLGLRLGTSAIFVVLVFFSIYLVLYSPIMLIFSVLFVSCIWVIDKKHSVYLNAVAEKSVQLEKLMREELSGAAIRAAHNRFVRAERLAVPVLYTFMIALGILLSWISIASRVPSYLNVFYLGLIVYLALYVYWMLKIAKE